MRSETETMKRQTPPSRNTEARRYALIGVFFGFLFPVWATVIRIASNGNPLNLSSVILAQTTDPLLWIIDTAPLFLGLFAALAGRRQDILQNLNTELQNREKELKNVQATLRQRVEERTAALEASAAQIQKRASQLEAIAHTARSAAVVKSLDELLPAVAQDIGSRFGFYHAGIFMLDERREFAILKAASSEGGKKMLDRGYRLRVGQEGVVGHVAYSGNPRVVSNVGEDAEYFDNPDLPEAHSEAALPLKFGDEIIGALDIQSKEVNAFSQEDLRIFSILADQVSIAIQNARSFEQAQRALSEAEAATSQLTGLAWKDFLETIRTRGYRYDGIKPEPVRKTSKPVENGNALTVPVQLRGQTIGRLKLKTPDPVRKWTEDELSIIEATAERVALAIDGARLLGDAQKRAARETLLAELAAKLGASFQLDSILRDTVEELGEALKGSTVTFQLVNPSALPTTDKDDGTARKSKDRSETG